MNAIKDASQAMHAMSGTGTELDRQETFMGELETKLEEVVTTANNISSEISGVVQIQEMAKKYFKDFSGVMAENQMKHDAEDALVEEIDPLIEQSKSITVILNTFMESVKASIEVLTSSMEIASAGSEKANEISGQIANLVA
jgi:uncharacterized coiled-coil DUF342 family protein